MGENLIKTKSIKHISNMINSGADIIDMEEVQLTVVNNYQSKKVVKSKICNKKV